MKMVKIKFQNPTDDAKGGLKLSKRFTVICLAQDTYEIPEQALSFLDSLSLPYVTIKTEGFDHAIRALRNPLASQV